MNKKYILNDQKPSSNSLIYILSTLYFLSITIFLIYHKSLIHIDQFIIFAYILLLLLGKSRNFIKDWLPFVILFLSYEYLRGIIPFFWKKIYVTPLIKADIFMFGQLPSIFLQSKLYKPGSLQWYDYFLTFVYFTHFITPLIIGLLIWLRDKNMFKKFTTSLLVLSYLGFLTYFLFPAMPPWLASSRKYVPNVYKIILVVFSGLGERLRLSSIYDGFNPNENAAMPSLHAAYPWLIFLLIIEKFQLNKKTVGFLIYTITVWFSLVYLGEHYVIDIIVGIIYASTVFIVFKTNHIRKQKKLSDIWNQVPVNYYESGEKNNLGQKIWHSNKRNSLAALFKIINKNRAKKYKILDVGSADGYLTKWVSNQWPNGKTYAVDVSEKLILAAKKKYPSLSFYKADAHKMPFRSGFFDLIICTETLEHVKNPNQVVKEIKRVLKNKGSLIVELDSNSWLFRLIWFFWTKIGPGRVWRNSHLTTFNPKTLIEILEKNGFKVNRKHIHNFGMAVSVLAVKDT